MTATPVHDRMGFVEHTLAELKARYGLKSVDVAMPSHMHDDHLNGFPHLVPASRSQGLVLREYGGRSPKPARIQPGLHSGRTDQD